MINIKEQIEILKEIQKVDTEIYALIAEKERIPNAIQVLENDFKKKQESAKALSDKLKVTQLKQKEKELELSAKEESIKKAQNQLYSLKTNKEYQAKLLEIQGIKADCSLLEETIIKILDEVDSINQQAKIEKEKLTQEEKIFSEDKKRYEARLKEIDERLKVLEAQKKQVSVNVDAQIFSQYEKVLHNRESSAIVAVVESACQGCHMSVAPQVINEIKMNKAVITCPACQRILYLVEE